jgi:hypothetical protein
MNTLQTPTPLPAIATPPDVAALLGRKRRNYAALQALRDQLESLTLARQGYASAVGEQYVELRMSPAVVLEALDDYLVSNRV